MLSYQAGVAVLRFWILFQIYTVCGDNHLVIEGASQSPVTVELLPITQLLLPYKRTPISANSLPKRALSSSSPISKLIPLLKDLFEPSYVIPNINLCPEEGEHLKIMIFVISALDHADIRMVIRKTWGLYRKHSDVGFGFLVGISQQSAVNDAIFTEQQTYGDLIQTSNMDTYRNLSLKSTSLLQWVDKYCPRVPFVLKVDDDVFINMPRLLIFLKQMKQRKRSIFGYIFHKNLPIRNPHSKYFLSRKEFAGDIFPDYFGGNAYIITQDAVHDIYLEALNTTHIPLEDVFITGIVAQNIGIHHVNVKNFRTEFSNNKNIQKFIAIFVKNTDEYFILWKKTCCHDF